VSALPVVTLTSAKTGEISYEIGRDGTLVLPRREAPASLHWRVEEHHGPGEAEVAILPHDESVTGASRARAADLLARWEHAQVVLEPLLLAATRAVAAGEAFERAALRPARVEPAPGVLVVPLRTPTLPPATHTNCVLVGAGAEVVLIEPATPYPDERARLEAIVAQLAAAGRRVVALLLTHHHLDHVGAAAELRERLGVPLLAHQETARRVRVPVDRTLADGEQAFGIQALFTPGHAPGHLCYLEPQTRTLVAGDMVAGEGTILVSPLDDGDMGLYLDSLARLRALDLHALVPAHGPPTAAPRALLEHYLSHRLMREERVVAALRSRGGVARADQILAQVYDDTPRAAWPLAALSLDAHLAKLVRDGRAQRDGAAFRLKGG